MAEEGDKIVPPYLSHRTLLNFLDKLKEQGIPARIDRSYWQSFLNGSVGPLLVSSLRFLGLTDETDKPTSILAQLAKQQEERKRILNEIIQARYAPVLAEIPIESATIGQLEEAFQKHFDARGSTKRKAITFFLNLSQFSGLELSPLLKDKRARSAIRTPSTVRKPRTNGASGGQQKPSQEQSSVPLPHVETVETRVGAANTKTIRLRSGGSVTLTVEADWFEVDPDEREFVLSLIDELRQYEQFLYERAGEDDLSGEEESEAAAASPY